MTVSEQSTFPPILAARRVMPNVRPFDEAVEKAARGELGAADALWSDDGGRAELAIVLEPEVAGDASWEIAAVMFLAVADSLGATMPPHTSVFLRWPDALLLNVGLAGTISLALESGADGRPPDWLVIGVSLQVGTLADQREPGDIADRTAIADEGGGHLAPAALLHAVAAHFLVWLDTWQQRGLAPFERRLTERIEGFDMPVLIRHGGEAFVGQVVGVDAGMALRVKPVIGDERRLRLQDARGDGAHVAAGRV